jgi:hypothetical protein
MVHYNRDGELVNSRGSPHRARDGRKTKVSRSHRRGKR